MRLEVTIDGAGPYFFPITKPTMVLGSARACDVRIPHMHVSRKHLAVTYDNGKYFVEDIGSTNGTFFGEERLAVSAKQEFNEYLPVKLGSVVFVALAEDAEGTVDDEEELLPGQSSRDASLTRIVTNPDHVAVAAPAVELHKKSPPRPPVAKNTKKKSALPFGLIQIVVGLVVVGSGYYFYVTSVPDDATAASLATVAVPAKNAPAVATGVVEEAGPEAVVETDFMARADIETLIGRVKCVTELELSLCNQIKGAKTSENSNWGAALVEEDMTVIVDGTSYYDEAKPLVKIPPEIEAGTASVAILNAYQDAIWQMAGMLFLSEGIPASINYDAFDDYIFIFGLFKREGEFTTLGAEIVIYPGNLEMVKSEIKKERLAQLRFEGPNAMDQFKKYFLVRSSDL